MAAANSTAARAALIRVRRSRVHGQGVFALRRIRKGTRVIEYLGDRISHARANRRYDDHDANDNHTFLFSVDRSLVIDAGVDGNEARFINHSCDPNCESVIERRRVFVDALRTIEPGEELSYDYQIGRERDDPANVDAIYACRCGAKDCRGTMLWPPKRPAPRRKARRAAKTAGKEATRRAAGRAARQASRGGLKQAAGQAGGSGYAGKRPARTHRRPGSKAGSKASGKAGSRASRGAAAAGAASAGSKRRSK